MIIISSPLGFAGATVKFEEVQFPQDLTGCVSYVGHPATRQLIEGLGAQTVTGSQVRPGRKETKWGRYNPSEFVTTVWGRSPQASGTRFTRRMTRGYTALLIAATPQTAGRGPGSGAKRREKGYLPGPGSTRQQSTRRKKRMYQRASGAPGCKKWPKVAGAIQGQPRRRERSTAARTNTAGLSRQPSKN